MQWRKNIISSLLEIQCSFMEKAINYHKKLLNCLENLSGKKKKLLLHVCCGPCFTIPFEILKDHFDITILFNNSNIYPKNEYDRRIAELKEYIKKNNLKCDVIEIPYNYNEFIEDLSPFKDQKEGQERCRICFRKRLLVGFQFAKENNFEYFGTVMSISRYKNAQDLNKIGYEL